IEKARELVRRMRKKVDITFRIGIGGIKDLSDMGGSYREALNALIMTTGSVAHADDLPLGCSYAGDYPIHLEKKLFSEVEKGELNNAIATANDFFDWMIETNPDSLMEIRLKILEFILWAEHLAYEKGGMTYQFNTRSDYLPEIMGMTESYQMKKWFIAKISDACQNILSKRTEKSDSIIEMAKEYIRLNFSRDLSLDEVSRAVNISPHYFSKIFKDGTGENFIEYVTNIRIDKAKELLGNPEYSIKEICSMIGYSDPNYFSRSFKKNVGVTPTEYREGRTTA
ncbi:MAG: helix-turn-helix domain-containing protein, partial [Lachnospiraceae bacterium]|nr:helix-turn-helix domain-containing protein [Lachnospiraceae bacterium]